jgi:MFS family permease
MNLTISSIKIELLKEHGGLIMLCFLMIFFSVFGQSIFFGAYLPMIREEIGLSKTFSGGLYAAATIASAVAIIFTGKKLDDYPLRPFVAIVLIMLAIGCLTMSFVNSALLLFIAFFILRQFGQGLLCLSSGTSINRYMDQNRGKAIAITGLGGPLHMMIFPVSALALNEYFDWRSMWQFYAAFIMCVLLPLFWFGLKSHQNGRHAQWVNRVEQQEREEESTSIKHWTRKEVLSNYKFYAILALLIVAPFVGTVIFFYQHELAISLGIKPITFAASFPLFTIASIITSLLAGHFIDLKGEKFALILYPLFYTIGLVALTCGQHIVLVYFAMFIIGAANGTMMTIGGPLLSHLYGTKHLGGIKSLVFSWSIFGSALSPFLFGFFMDKGIDIKTLFFVCSFYSGGIWLLAFPICKNIRHTPE